MRKRRSVALIEALRLIPWYIIMDLIVFAVSLLFEVDKPSMVIGLIVGSAYAIFNFYLMGLSAERAVWKTPEKARTYMTLNYLIRYTLMIAVFSIIFTVDAIHPIAGLLPFLYIKLILIIRAFRKEDKDGRAKDRI